MRAVDRTTKQFVRAVKDAVPGIRVQVERSVTRFGRSHYIHLRDREQRRYWKVRISDHDVGMRRAGSGQEDLYLSARARPDQWSVWLGEFRREVLEQ